MSLVTRRAALLGAGAGLMLARRARAEAAWPTAVRVGTASQGGTYFVYGAGLAKRLQEVTGVPASAQVTKGPMQNMALVHTARMDIGMTNLGPAFESWHGRNPVLPGEEMRDVRALFPMYQSPFQTIVLADSGISGYADMADARVGIGPAGGTSSIYVPAFMKTLGIPIRKRYGGAADQAGQLQDGLIDVFAFAAGVPVAAFRQVEAQTETRIIPFTDEEVAVLREAFPAAAPYTLADGIYDGQDGPVQTLAMWNVAMAHKDLPADFIEAFVASIMDNPQSLETVHKAARETRLSNVAANTFMWFHPGAVSYYRKRNIPIADHLLPPEMTKP